MDNDTIIPRYIFGVDDGFSVVALDGEQDLGLVACRSIQAASRITSDTPGATIYEVTGVMKTKTTLKENDMAKPNTVYFTRKHLIQASRLGQKWDFNRQLADHIAEVPESKYPVEAFLVQNHRHGVRSEPHIRCMISLAPFSDGAVFCDVPTNYFKKLPKMRSKHPTQFLGER